VFSNQKWDRLSESHAKDIVVTWPDGHETKGIDKHIADLKTLFVWAPDTAIKEHPIRFGSGTWTTAQGVMSGTFTKPMPTPERTRFPARSKRPRGMTGSLPRRSPPIPNCFGTAPI
jgi:hypothetical protein